LTEEKAEGKVIEESEKQEEEAPKKIVPEPEELRSQMKSVTLNAGKKVYLTFEERVILPGVLPQNGSYTEMHLVRGIIDKVRFGLEEEDKFQIQRSPNGGISWSKEASQFIFEKTFDHNEVSLIKDQLMKLDKDKKLSLAQSGLYEKFFHGTGRPN
jgi:hypothetical protein